MKYDYLNPFLPMNFPSSEFKSAPALDTIAHVSYWVLIMGGVLSQWLFLPNTLFLDVIV